VDLSSPILAGSSRFYPLALDRLCLLVSPTALPLVCLVSCLG
jgi:hypothetical protein